ncbi:HTTM domain-containing protein [Streptomyces sp. GC420]|uniref:HTTM domain-containing protein n=1 Tax=Streptomyces sp. GC420 TaxID=2697568 RepID=UPI001FB7EDCA|nr:HTTM domain-containing protein [Streptomyces sp. GC420]
MSGLARTLAKGVHRVTATALGPYQSAVVRIGFAGTWLLFLLREFPVRHELYGPGGPWSFDLAQRLISDNGAFTVLMWSDARLWFEFVYALSMVAAALLMLGWRTRSMSVLFMIGVLSLQNRSVFVGDGGDNVIHLMALYLVLTRCAQVWSLDARRARRHPESREARDPAGIVLWVVLGLGLAAAQLLGRTGLTWTDGPLPWVGWSAVLWGLWLVQAAWWAVKRYAPGEPRVLLDVLANLAHNAALLVIMVEVCLIYATAGWYKIQGSRWQDGTALHYPLHLDYFTPWTGLSELMAANGTMVMAVSYGTVIVQVAFPFTLFNRRVKNVLLAGMMLEHAAIAVILGLPFFSLAMITADSVFLPTGFLRRVGDLANRTRRGLRSRLRRRLPASLRRPVPGQRGPSEDEEPVRLMAP